MNLTLGISTCPNDTYIFGALINKLIESRFKFQTIMDDVEVLNNIAQRKNLDIIKVSYGVIPQLLDKYDILKSGGALGFGCGPLLVSNKETTIRKLETKKIGIPGKNTSAFRIFKMFFGENFDFYEMRFDLIMPAILSNKLDAGIIIHEGRFTFKDLGLTKIVDLGDKWEKKYNAPIPLGAIVINKNKSSVADEINDLIKSSIRYAENNYSELKLFIKSYAQELSDDIIKKHIDMFVNEYSYDLSKYINTLSEFLNCDKSCFV